MQDHSSVQYLNVCQLLQIMLCTPPNNSPAERVYTYLNLSAAKHSNQLSNDNHETSNLLRERNNLQVYILL